MMTMTMMLTMIMIMMMMLMIYDDDNDDDDDEDDDDDDDDDFHTFWSQQVCQWVVQQISPYCTCIINVQNFTINVQNIAPHLF